MEQDALNEILEEFFTEAEENLDQLEQDLIQLETLAEEGDTDPETVNRIFRVLHTLKGGAGFLGMDKMAKLAHAGENLLDEVRNEKVAVTKPVMDVLLQTNDMLKSMLAMNKAREDDSGVNNDALIAALEALAKGQEAEAPAAAASAAPAAAEVPAPAPAASLMDEVLADDSLHPDRDTGEDAPALPPAPPPPLVNQDLLSEVMADETLHPDRDQGDDTPPVAKPASAAPAAAGPLVNQDLLNEVMSDETLHPDRDKGDDTPPAAAGPLLARTPEPVAEQRTGDDRRQHARRSEEAGQETIRVETSRLDKVMNLVGELVLARNTLVRQMSLPAARAAMETLENAGQISAMIEQLSLVTQDLQMSVLSTRMQPVKKVFDKIPRQVRELKTKLGKDVNLIIEGEMTEVDKTLVEELADPMVHMIRNALDHGLETPEERIAMGKHPEGTLVVRAFYEGSNVVIQVQEDGKGIDPERIRAVAVRKGLATEEAVSAMSDNEVIRLIIAPGFSTAEKITDVSGRGVGMDVVNSKIMKMQGSIDIRSELGMGTCFSIYLPLTLAIVSALVVETCHEGFAIPIGDIAEVIKFDPEIRHRVSDRDVIELRGESLPLFYLASLTRHGHVPDAVRRPAASADVLAAKSADALSLDDLEQAVAMAVPEDVRREKANRGFVVVVRDGTNSMGLVVDELLGQEEVVVKPVTDMFEYNKAVSGATISGDGKVHMILDVPYMVKNMSGGRA